ncbi:MAG: glycine dehydrogenase (aminomethyl-transferring), partial [Burkholderiales bacterium]
MSTRDTHLGDLRSLLGTDEFHGRHIGPQGDDETLMLAAIGYASRRDLIRDTVPAGILRDAPLALCEPTTEAGALAELQAIANQNQIWRSYIGAGYHNTLTPEPIRRNVLENPGWYTAYTPYQAEVAQGRLESLLNFQQMVIDLTGLEVANASLLDEATAAAEAMGAMRRASKSKSNRFLVDASVHPQVIAVIRTRAHWMGLEVVVADALASDASGFFGAHVQCPDTEGRLRDFSALAEGLHAAGARLCIGVDPLAALLVKSAGEMGADMAIGSAQRFGVPLGNGGPHAAFMAARNDMLRTMPGRIIGVSKDAAGNLAYRMSLQTREQHIRRDKATSNICTAQALLANMAAFYAVYHGPQGLLRIALRTHAMARLLVEASGLAPVHSAYFDTVVFDLAAAGQDAAALDARAAQQRINLRMLPGNRRGVALDETTGLQDVADLVWVLTGRSITAHALQDGPGAALGAEPAAIAAPLRRSARVLTHPVFNRYHTETEFVRYLKRLENRDISLVHSMIPLGSCTMKLNAAAE